MADTKKYLDLVGLRHYDDKIKKYIADQITSVNNSIADLDKIKGNAEKGLVAYNAWATFLATTPTGSVTPTLAQLATKDELTQAISKLKGTATAG